MFKRLLNWLRLTEAQKDRPASSTKEQQASFATKQQVEELLASPDTSNWELAFTLLEQNPGTISKSIYQLICSDIGYLTVCTENEHWALLRPFPYLHINGYRADNPHFRYRFSMALGELHHLEELSWVGRNYLLKTNYVTAVQKLQGLRRLRLTQVYFKDLEKAVCQLPLLEKLDLSQNRPDSLPDEFSRLQQLKHLSLDYCFFKELPSVIYELPQLVHLSMQGNPLEIIDPKGFRQLPNLQYLRLPGRMASIYKSKLRSFLPAAVFEYPHWEKLD